MIEETTFEKLRKALLELLRGYPEYVYHGKFEFYLTNTREKSVDLLLRHKIIEELPKKEVKNLNTSNEEKTHRWYRLAPRGVDLAISMINLEHSEKMNKFTKIIILLGISTLIFTIEQVIFLLI